MTNDEISEVVHTMRVVREQLAHGYLTVAGMQATWRELLERLPQLDGEPAIECEWLLLRIEDELLARELDTWKATP